MSELLLPGIILAFALGFAFDTYRHIRRGGARHYTLEREAVLRKASGRLFLATLFFLGAFGYLAFAQGLLTTTSDDEPAAAIDASDLAPTATADSTIESSPRDPAPPPTAFPTGTPTAVIVRGMIEGTGGNGLTLRADPSVNGDSVLVLPDGTIVTILDEEPVVADGYTWVRIRTIANDEGWLAQDFLVTRDR